MRSASLAWRLAAVLAAAVPAVASAQTVVTFETGANCDNFARLAVVQGVDFLEQWSCFGFDQSPYTAHSPTNRAYTAITVRSASFAFAAPTVFDGAWFAGVGDMTFDLYRGGALVGSSSSLTISDVPAFLASGYRGVVDSVTVNGSTERYVMDDVTYGGSAVTAPEPGSLGLVAGGLLAVGAWRRRARAADLQTAA